MEDLLKCESREPRFFESIYLVDCGSRELEDFYWLDRCGGASTTCSASRSQHHARRPVGLDYCRSCICAFGNGFPITRWGRRWKQSGMLGRTMSRFCILNSEFKSASGGEEVQLTSVTLLVALWMTLHLEVIGSWCGHDVRSGAELI
jgi:hypothetical protein